MPVIKGRKELGSRKSVVPPAKARVIDSKVKDFMDGANPNSHKQGKGAPLQGRQPKTGHSQKTRDLAGSEQRLQQALGSAYDNKAR